jgi:uncharacterized protein
MFTKEDVRFPVDGGIELSACLFVPEHPAPPLPAITMAPAAPSTTASRDGHELR